MALQIFTAANVGALIGAAAGTGVSVSVLYSEYLQQAQTSFQTYYPNQDFGSICWGISTNLGEI